MDIFTNRLFKSAAVLFFALYVGKYLGEAVLARQHMIVIALFIGAAFLLLSSVNQKFYLLSLSVFIPFLFNRFLVRNLLWIELLAPLFCFLMMIDLIMNRKNMFSKEAKLYYIAIGILFVWFAINFARNPVLGAFFGQSAEGSGIRAYLAIFVGIMLFFYSFWYFRDVMTNSNKWLGFLIIASLFFGYLRFAGYFAGFSIPFVGKVFAFRDSETSAFMRIGGLQEMAVLGVAAVLTYYNSQRWKIQHILLLSSFFVLLFFSGARAASIGIIFMFIAYISLVNRRYFLPIMFLLIIAVSSFFIFIQGAELPSQVQRLMAIEGGVKKQDKYRAKTYETLLGYFSENMIFGKGIGLQGSLTSGRAFSADVIDEEEEKKKDEDADAAEIKKKRGGQTKEDFAAIQSYIGGHGSYVSILSLFGIGGLVYFLIMLYGSIYYSYKIFKRRSPEDSDSKLALFSFLYLLAHTLIYIVEGAGYNRMELWFFAGMVAGVKAKNGV